MSQFENDGTFGARKVSDRIITCVAMTVLTVTLCAQTVRAAADELVKFDSAPYIMGQIQQRQAREGGETLANAPGAGGIVALKLASTHAVDLFAFPDNLKFKAAVAYYPLCSAATDQLTIPTIILVGELDDWTPAKDCERWMERRAGKGALAKLIVYPGAYHAFDIPTVGNGMRSFGRWHKYDADAANRSILEVRDFLANELTK